MKNITRREVELVHTRTKLIYPGVVKLARECYGSTSIFIISDVLHGLHARKEDMEGYEASYFIRNWNGERFNLWEYNTFEKFWQNFCEHKSKPVFDGFFIRFKKAGSNFKRILI